MRRSGNGSPFHAHSDTVPILVNIRDHIMACVDPVLVIPIQIGPTIRVEGDGGQAQQGHDLFQSQVFALPKRYARCFLVDYLPSPKRMMLYQYERASIQPNSATQVAANSRGTAKASGREIDNPSLRPGAANAATVLAYSGTARLMRSLT